jgi:hypothetical protein
MVADGVRELNAAISKFKFQITVLFEKPGFLQQPETPLFP